MSKKAVVIGATGLVGKHLLEYLLEDDFYSAVTVYARKPLEKENPKLTQIIGDLLDDDFFGDCIEADHTFCCIGTTQSKTPDLSLYKNIDYGIPVRVAQMGLKGGMDKFLVISSMGANEKSHLFYPRVKGQMEKALRKMGIPHLHIFRPSLILGKRDEFRVGEKLGIFLYKIFGFLIPAKYKGIQATTIARAMQKIAKGNYSQTVYLSHEIQKAGSD